MKSVVGMIALILAQTVLAREQEIQNGFNPELYLMPFSSYTRFGRSLAQMYQPELVSMVLAIKNEIKSGRFELMDLNHSPKGGAGFWTNPAVFSPHLRYLGVIARVNIRLPYFPDSTPGRMTDALDAFGKDLFRIMGNTLDKIPDSSIKGIVLIIIYSKAELNDPKFYEQAEALVVFISRDDLKKYNSFRISLQKLFDRSDYYYFYGQEQINILLNEFIRG